MRFSSSIQIPPSVYPTARRDESIVDNFHGTMIHDPYRWMEDPDSEETRHFVDQLNAISEPFIAQAPSREKIRNRLVKLRKLDQIMAGSLFSSIKDVPARLTELWDYEKYSCPSKRGNFYYYSYNSGLQNQYVIYQQKNVHEKGEVFLDPNTLSADGTTFLRISAWTKDGSILAYGLSEKGSDWVTVKFRGADKKDLKDTITGVKHSSLSWMNDKSGLFYCKYPDHKVHFFTQESAIDGTSVEKHENHSLFFHRMGTDCKEDVLVYDRRECGSFMMFPLFSSQAIYTSVTRNYSGGTVTEDGRYLIVDVSRGCDPFNMLYYYDLSTMKGPIGKINPTPLFDKLDAKYEVCSFEREMDQEISLCDGIMARFKKTFQYVDHDDDSMLIHTNHNAPMFKLIRVSLKDRSIKEVVPENPRHKLDWATPVAGDRLVLSYIEDVKDALYVHDLSTGSRLYSIPLKVGSISGFFGKKILSEMFFSFESFTVPTIIYRIDFASVDKKTAPQVQELRRVRVPGMDENDFTVQQVFYESKDKTKVPMYIISLKGAQKTGNTPTILNGYGGFNVSDMPYFSVSRLLVVKHFRGIIACANLRGGSEYGEAWHMGGMREKKQNVFDDFIAAAEYLIKNKYTNCKRLAIHGGSNGGLLVAACSQQRPELYGAVLNRVGVMDMLRFHKFTVGGAWVPEFGNPDVEKDFHFISKYSPLHNIKFPEGRQWPSTLLMTADHDDRVVPSHTLKYAATLYEKVGHYFYPSLIIDDTVGWAKKVGSDSSNRAKLHEPQTNPLLVRVEVKAGHGAGKPTAKVIAEIVDMYSFLQRVLDIEWKD
uniref:Prolyl endopeptidase n=1 Tax=Haemonchus placei TaxID=6290 RepID=A0A158QK63_HAEPC